MKAIIVDDEQHLAQDLCRRISRLWPELDIIAVLHDGHAASSALAECRPDIAFLDIRMPGQSGLDVAREAPAECRIVFITAFDDHAVEAFEQAAVDYLLKPVTDERLVRCLERLKEQSTAVSDALMVNLQQLLATVQKPEFLRWLRIQVGESVRMVAVEEVCYFKSSDKYTQVLTPNAELLLRMSIKELIRQLDPELFWQVHRGTVVNVRQIVAAHRTLLGKVSLMLRDRPEHLDVSRSYTHLFRQM